MSSLERNLASLLGFLCAACLLPAFPVRAEMWTNQVGRAIEGQLVGFDGISVTLVRTNGIEFKLPLTALRPADQRRVRLQTAHSVAPRFVLAAYKDASKVLDQFRKLPAEQQSDEARHKAVEMARLVFDGRLKDRSTQLADREVQAEVKRLRASLADPAK